MENWAADVKALYKTSSVAKEYLGNSGRAFRGQNTVAGSIKVTQSISAAEQLTYGSVEPAMLEFQIATESGGQNFLSSENEQIVTDDGYNLKVQYVDFAHLEITLTQDVGNYNKPIGVFIVDACELVGDTWFKNVTAYDRLILFSRNVAEWYNSIDFSQAVTIKDMREKLCGYIGVPYEDAELPNDSVVLEKTISPSQISGADVLSACCELSACWPQMSPEGVLRWVTLGNESCETFSYDDYDQAYRPESTRETYVCKGINAVVIRATEDDVGGHYPPTLEDNPYIIQDNFLVYGKSTAALSTMAQNVLASIGGKTYRPHTTIVAGRPYLQCGDMITVETQKETYTTYILKRTLSGENNLTDTYEAQGSEQVTQGYGLSRQIIQLKGRTNELVRTVDTMKSTITDIEVGMSEIEQTASGISLTVSGLESDISTIEQTTSDISLAVSSLNGTVSALSLYVGGITLSASNGGTTSSITLKSGNTVISSAQISITGVVTFTALSTQGQTAINGSNITTGKISAARIDVDNLYVKHLTSADGTFTGSLSGVDGTFSGSLSASGGDVVLNENNIEIGGVILTGENELGVNSNIGASGFYADNDVSVGSRLYMVDPPDTSASANVRLVSRAGGYSLSLITSSRRYKKDICNIRDYDDVTDRIDRVPAVTYTPRGGLEKGRYLYGFIAEDMETEFPWLVDYKNIDGVLCAESVQYDRVPAILWTDAQLTHEKLQRLDDIARELSERLLRLEERNSAL